MNHTIEQAIGAIVLLLILLDVFLTVLYARARMGPVSYRIARLTWRVFMTLSKLFGRERGAVLSFCGPAILVLFVIGWGLMLMLGAALIIHPALGDAVRADNGTTPTDFITALYAAGSSVAIVGSGKFTPQSAAFRIFYLFTSLIGMSIVSLTLTYLMQVYSGLQRRNILGLKLHLAAAETADAAELIARLGPNGQFNGGYTNLSETAVEMTAAKESHHFYPVLFYFRFRDSYYSVSSFALLALDTVTLIKSALDDQRYGWLKKSAPVAELWRATLLLLTTLDRMFLPGGVSEAPAPDAPTLERWRRRYFAALRRLRQAGIHTIVDEQTGVRDYISLRSGWDIQITRLAPALAYRMEEIDPAGNRTETVDERPAFTEDLRSAG